MQSINHKFLNNRAINQFLNQSINFSIDQSHCFLIEILWSVSDCNEKLEDISIITKKFIKTHIHHDVYKIENKKWCLPIFTLCFTTGHIPLSDTLRQSLVYSRINIFSTFNFTILQLWGGGHQPASFPPLTHSLI